MSAKMVGRGDDDSDSIFTGFEVGTGNPIYIEPSHLIVCGTSHISGKSTTLQALSARAKRYKFLVFKTKPGERVFAEGRSVAPFFNYSLLDWEGMEKLLAATTGKPMQSNEVCIMIAMEGRGPLPAKRKEEEHQTAHVKAARSIEEFYANCKRLAEEDESRKNRESFLKLTKYLEKMFAEIDLGSLSTQLSLKEGMNVMDLTGYRPAIQSILINSCLDEILNRETRVIVVLPEAQKFVPQGRGNVVKDAIENLIRQGAELKNYVWLDSQDIASLAKAPLKQVPTWCLGTQTEYNEIEHTLKQINVPSSFKPSVDQVASLKLGHFYISTPESVHLVYIQPLWLGPEVARRVALGEIDSTRVASTSSGASPALSEPLPVEQPQQQQIIQVRQQAPPVVARRSVVVETVSDSLPPPGRSKKGLAPRLKPEEESIDALLERMDKFAEAHR